MKLYELIVTEARRNISLWDFEDKQSRTHILKEGKLIPLSSLTGILTILTGIINILTGIINILMGILNIFTGVLNILTGIINILTGIINILTGIINILMGILNIFTGVLTILTGILNILTGILNILTGILNILTKLHLWLAIEIRQGYLNIGVKRSKVKVTMATIQKRKIVLVHCPEFIITYSDEKDTVNGLYLRWLVFVTVMYMRL
ncbi:hypothetical protein CHS0354_030691 [Potamilus streckersoni]|uniref:Uncharacterized protein n=1 Tax=Potamilus streckersoni TaxID=2493646 RepID=A0AAE0S747_9BIVA|nr:hypothetical protein CHS0354_030691 [Potamilus streckersoni]